MDARTRNRRVAAFEAAARREAAPGSLPVQPAGAAAGQIIHLAYCKTAAGSGNTITAFLDKDSTGREITVNFIIYTPSGAGGNLNASLPFQNLKDGDPLQVIFMNGKWYNVGSGVDSEECDTE